jgi:hypothetical protein
LEKDAGDLALLHLRLGRKFVFFLQWMKLVATFAPSVNSEGVVKDHHLFDDLPSIQGDQERSRYLRAVGRSWSALFPAVMRKLLPFRHIDQVVAADTKLSPVDKALHNVLCPQDCLSRRALIYSFDRGAVGLLSLLFSLLVFGRKHVQHCRCIRFHEVSHARKAINFAIQENRTLVFKEDGGRSPRHG